MTDTIPQDFVLNLIEWMGVLAALYLLAFAPAFRKRRAVAFKFTRREVILSLAIYAVLLLGAIAYYTDFFRSFSPAVAIAAGSSAPFEYSTDQMIRQISFALAVASPVILATLIRRQPWLSVGLAKATNRAGIEAGLGIALLTIVLTSKVSHITDGVSAAELRYLAAMLLTAFSQELVFRGFLQLRLVNAMGEDQGWLATAILFAIWQMPQLIFVTGVAQGAMAWSQLSLLGMGLVLGWMMRKSGNILVSTLYQAIHYWVRIL